jgi:hypothetical protein
MLNAMKILVNKKRRFGSGSQATNLTSFGPDIAWDRERRGSKTFTLKRLLDIALDVAIMALIVASFLWGGYASKMEPAAVKPAQTSPRD